jgi:hypothetical protein
VVIWRVDVALLTKEDWKYETSKAGPEGGGRTHTFGLKRPSRRLAGAAAFTLPGIILRGGKPIVASG